MSRASAATLWVLVLLVAAPLIAGDTRDVASLPQEGEVVAVREISIPASDLALALADMPGEGWFVWVEHNDVDNVSANLNQSFLRRLDVSNTSAELNVVSLVWVFNTTAAAESQYALWRDLAVAWQFDHGYSDVVEGEWGNASVRVDQPAAVGIYVRLYNVIWGLRLEEIRGAFPESVESLVGILLAKAV